jgi:glycosyltransferase involved in cell wall biosynthesis
MQPISAVIITYNEEDRIAAAIASLSCCDEVLVMDAYSTDRTLEVAQRCGARIIQRAWDGYSSQKNFAAAQTAHDWILSIDADERVSIELSNEILAWKRAATAGEPAAYSMPRRVFYFGKWIRHSGWYPDRKVRLYDRRRAKWGHSRVHEELHVDGPILRLNGDLLHFTYRSWADQIARADRYAELAAEGRQQDKIIAFLKLVAGPPAAFLKAFVFRTGFLDGWRGAAIAYAAARYVFRRQFLILRSAWKSL